MDLIMKLVSDHPLALSTATLFTGYIAGRIDDIIVFLLRFFNAQTIKDELDRLDTLAKARVDKDAAQLLKAVPGATSAAPGPIPGPVAKP